ncbi:MAG: JAB domain-containing protein [Chakrabartia sp.]
MDRPPPFPSAQADWLSQIEVRLNGATHEVVAIAYLDADEELVGLRVAGDGSTAQVELPLRDILRDVLDHQPQALVLAHNHPSGDPRPSATDQRATKTLCTMLRPIGVSIADHIIVSGDQRISFRDLGLL